MADFTAGDTVLSGGKLGVVETTWRSVDGQVYVLIRPGGQREVCMGGDVHAVPRPEDPVRREAVDLILDYKGVPRSYLFEYPYNAHESRIRIREAEALLDELLEVLEK